VAAVHVGGQVLGLPAEAPEDEHDILWRHTLYALLNDMVGELVVNTPEHLVTKPFGHRNLVVVFRYIQGLKKQRQQMQTEAATCLSNNVQSSRYLTLGKKI
jgi:hypothetical protein